MPVKMVSLLGCQVSLKENEETFLGEVIQEDPKLGKLSVMLEEGGLQVFFRRDLSSLTVIDDEQTMVGEDATTDEGFVSSEAEMKNIFASVKPLLSLAPDSYGLGSKTRNHHLRSLQPLDMAQLVGHAPWQEELIEEARDSQGWSFFKLPTVVCTAKPRIDANGNVIDPEVRNYAQKMIRGRLWADPDTPPSVSTPSRLYLVPSLGSLYEEAVSRLLASQVLGLAGQGDLRGRAAPLAWLMLSTQEDVFMFDTAALGEEGWSYGLRTLLQDAGLTKVTHDCRALSDCLWHRHQVLLAGVWDTMAADTVFLSRAVYRGLLPRYSRPQAALLWDYLGVREDHIAFPRVRRDHLAWDQRLWLARPLPSHLPLAAARSVLYLAGLYSLLRAATLQPFHRAVAVLNSEVRELEAAAMATDTDLVSRRLLGLLPNWDSSQYLRLLDARRFTVEGNFLHNNTGNPDPGLIYSKDCMHTTSPGFPAFQSILEAGKEEHVVTMRGLPYRATEEEVVEWFSPVARCLSARIEREDGRPSGEALATFSTAEEARKARAKHGQLMGARYIELADGGRFNSRPLDY